jgi:hypothetical protein
MTVARELGDQSGPHHDGTTDPAKGEPGPEDIWKEPATQLILRLATTPAGLDTTEVRCSAARLSVRRGRGRRDGVMLCRARRPVSGGLRRRVVCAAWLRFGSAGAADRRVDDPVGSHTNGQGDRVMSIRANTCGFLAVILIVSGGTSSGRADSRRGEWFAEKWCSQCHAIRSDQISANPSAPRFSDLAANPSISDASLRAFLRTTPHWSMPKLKLKSNDLNDVIGYILSPRSFYGGR